MELRGDPIADLLDADVERLESDLGARHVQEVLAQLVSGSLPQLSGETDFDPLPSVPALCLKNIKKPCTVAWSCLVLCLFCFALVRKGVADICSGFRK